MENLKKINYLVNNIFKKIKTKIKIVTAQALKK